MSGNAVPGCGTIHIDEVKPTLTKLSDDLEFPFDLNDYVLGSTGKKLYSGDIDLVLDKKWWSGGAKQLKQDAIQIVGEENVNLNGALLHIKYPIANYDASKDERLPRTGYVQIDFNFGDYKLLKMFNWAPGPESNFKGLHRNIAIASVAGVVDAEVSDQKDSFDRPVRQERWKWSPKGLIRILRTSKGSNGTWNKTQKDIDLREPIIDQERIAQILFRNKGTIDDMNSLESVIEAVKRTHEPNIQESIFQRMAYNFTEKSVVNGYEYPPEISKYFFTGDK